MVVEEELHEEHAGGHNRLLVTLSFLRRTSVKRGGGALNLIQPPCQGHGNFRKSGCHGSDYALYSTTCPNKVTIRNYARKTVSVMIKTASQTD